VFGGAVATLARHYRRAWAIDFEFRQPDGSTPEVRCMVARDLLSGVELRRWRDELADCPFDCDRKELFIAYMGVAEAACFAALNWPLPRRMLDLFVEFRRLTNGIPPIFGNSLLGALQYFSLPAGAAADKADLRALAMREGSYNASERVELLDYCASDVSALERLLPLLWQAAGLGQPSVFGQALIRGRYMMALAVVERNGVPIDRPNLDLITRNISPIRRQIAGEAAARYGCYDGASFSVEKFATYIVREGLPWPRLNSGALDLDDDAFADMEKIAPQLDLLRATRQLLSKMNLTGLSVGRDERARTGLWPFASKTSRNQPSTTKFVFGPAKWVRSLIKPTRGRAIAYLDWSGQENAVAAALSGDDAMWADYAAGDPYLGFAKRTGLAPPDATKVSHREVRALCKTIILGVAYGMGAETLAQRRAIHVLTARDLLERLRAAYPRYQAWSSNVQDRALLGEPLHTAFGWTLRWPPGSGIGRLNPRTASNFPMRPRDGFGRMSAMRWRIRPRSCPRSPCSVGSIRSAPARRCSRAARQHRSSPGQRETAGPRYWRPCDDNPRRMSGRPT
jgi:hypothetical protein